MARKVHLKLDVSWAVEYVSTACSRNVLTENASDKRANVTCKRCLDWLLGYGPSGF